MSTLRDFAYGLRSLRSAPGFTAAAVITVAAGIAVNTAVFSVIDTVLLRELPYAQPERLVRIHETEPQLPQAPVTMPDVLDWRAQARSFEAIACWRSDQAAFRAGGGEPERIAIAEVTPDFFATLGVRPAVGRDFRMEDAKPVSSIAVILSDGLWQRRFGGDRGIIGRTIVVEGMPLTVIGVMPRGFRAPSPGRADLWYPMALVSDESKRGNHDRWALARLKPGVTIEQAQAEMTHIAAQLERSHPATNGKIGALVVDLKAAETGNVREILLIVLGAVAFVLLISCVNVASLLLARGAGRRQELAVRSALGASRWHLVRQLLAESLLIATAAGVLGTGLAAWSLELIPHMEALRLPRMDELAVNRGFLLYACAITLGSGLLFGIVPALQLSSKQLEQELREGSGRSSGGGRIARWRSAFVVAEVALSVVLLAGAGLMMRTVVKLLEVDPGFRPERVLSAEILLSALNYKEQEQNLAFAREVVERVRAIPGVTAASVTSKLPLKGGNNGTVIVEGKPYSTTTFDGPLVEMSFVLPGYFEAMGVPLKLGRTLAESDVSKQPKQVVVNEAFVRTFFPGENPIGRRISQERNPPDWSEIAGVVGDTRQWGLRNAAIPEVYVPALGWRAVLVLQTALDPAQLKEPLRKQIAAVNPNVPAFDILTMQEVVESSSASQKGYSTLLAVFAGVAVLLACIGIYGLIASAVAQRSQEIGIRMALGASRAEILRMVLGQFSKLVALGLAAGLGAALLLSRLLSAQLYGVTAADPVTYAVVLAVLVVVALAASAVPASRAARLDPAAALRHD